MAFRIRPVLVAVLLILAFSLAVPAATQTFKVGDKVILNIKTVSGNISVTGWDKREVKVDSVVEGDNVRPEVTQRDGEILIREIHENPGFFGSSGSVNFKIYAPSGAMIDGKSISGVVTLERLNGSVEFKTVSGELSLTTAAPAEVDLSSVSGDVFCRLEKRYANSLGINNVSGNIELVLVAGGDAYCRFGTISGDITVKQKLEDTETKKGYGSEKITGRLGQGTGKITLSTVSGDITLR
jgi:DUF4097 and DUF4098 domain-containing protein YvlB